MPDVSGDTDVGAVDPDDPHDAAGAVRDRLPVDRDVVGGHRGERARELPRVGAVGIHEPEVAHPATCREEHDLVLCR